jgi:hypothetical protein
MEEADGQRPQPQHDKTAITTSNTKQLSDESDAGEPEENYRGWKAMPYVIGELTTPV